MPRENFSSTVKKSMAASAGHQCSFPSCNQLTVGPGASTDYVSNSGYAAHIYAASAGGPRGQGGLSPQELKAAGNGIWLCGRHAKLIDNNRGTTYPPEVLLSYKALHEARVLLEHEGLYPPIGWLHEFTVVQGPIFSGQQTFQLAKLNLIYGRNETGKTALAEWIAGFFDPHQMERWIPVSGTDLNVRMKVLNPKLQNLSMTVCDSKLSYVIDGRAVPFIPIGFRVIKPSRLIPSENDDLKLLASCIGVSELVMNGLLAEVNSFPHATVSNLRFEYEHGDEEEVTKQRLLIADVQGTAPGLSLRALSGRERERIILELATAAARLSGRYCPTLLILDEAISIIFEGFFDFYSRHLLDPMNQFQTLMCIPDRKLDLNHVKWNGWQVIRMEGESPKVSISQDIRS
jgi:hypothetical protein